jgi:ATP-dependent Clp protease ATP-binding subunit ClpC
MREFLSWHYSENLGLLLTIFRNYLIFFSDYFSVSYLLRNIFAPWKRITEEYTGPALNLGKYFESMTFNLISSVIGATVRIVALITWFLCTLFLMVFFLVILIVYLLLPIVSLPFFFSAKAAKANSLPNLLAAYSGDSFLLYQKIFTWQFASFLFDRLEVAQEDYKALAQLKNTPEMEPAFHEKIRQVKPTLTEVIKVFLENYAPLSNLLSQKHLEIEEVLSVVSWWERQKAEEERKKRFYDPENLASVTSLGKDWVYGYTINLDKFAQDLSYEALLKPRLVGRRKEIERTEMILAKRGENNVLLLGEPGVGRKAIVYGFAQRIAQRKASSALLHKRVLLFDLNSAIAEEKTVEGKRAKLLSILKEARDAGNVVLAITSFDKFVSSGLERINLSDIFAQVIGSSDLQVIGLTTPEEFHRHIQPNPIILKLFETIGVFPPTKEEAMEILEDLTASFEKKDKVFISYFAIKEIIDRVDILVTDVPFPEKAINFLDEVVTFGRAAGISFIKKETVDILLSEKTKIPLTELTRGEREKLLNLENFLHTRVVDQEESIQAIASAMRRGRLRVGTTTKPIGSFLFLGPTGVGKTETAKALANLYFGSEARLIRFDMAEFVGVDAVEKLIGTAEGRPGLLTTAVKDMPFAVLLLDEFEKTTKEVLSLFLTVFDEGYLRDSRGKSISFVNLIIIATSNAGAEFIREEVQKGASGEDLSKKLVEHVLSQRIFAPELINRFDGVVVYKPLTTDHLHQIAKLMIGRLNERLKIEQKISIKLTEELINQVATLGFDPVFGARPMARVIQEKIEEPLAKMILEGKVKKGEEVEIKI